MSAQRGYHHGDLKEALLAAALESIAREGTERLSLRALAREAGVSPTAPYRHFPTKNCLLAALMTRGFRDLQTQLLAAAEAQDPEERFVQVGLAYVRFALGNPTSYNLMFSPVVGDFTNYPELGLAAAESYDVVLNSLEALRVQERVPGLTLSAAGGVAWSAVHGLSSVLLFGRGRGSSTAGPRSPLASLIALEQQVDDALRLLLRGLLG
ncbi:MAG: TetR/AcrR family transcriptional regulator [Pseudomonadales bacterium]